MSIFSGWSLFCVLLCAVLLYVYIVFARPHLKTLPGFKEAFDREATFWSAVKVWAEGRKTILIGVWGEIVAIGPDALQQIAGLDLKKLMNLPDLWAAWVTAIIPILMILFRSRAK